MEANDIEKTEEKRGLNFVEEIVFNDLREGKDRKSVV